MSTTHLTITLAILISFLTLFSTFILLTAFTAALILLARRPSSLPHARDTRRQPDRHLDDDFAQIWSLLEAFAGGLDDLDGRVGGLEEGEGVVREVGRGQDEAAEEGNGEWVRDGFIGEEEEEETNGGEDEDDTWSSPIVPGPADSTSSSETDRHHPTGQLRIVRPYCPPVITAQPLDYPHFETGQVDEPARGFKASRAAMTSSLHPPYGYDYAYPVLDGIISASGVHERLVACRLCAVLGEGGRCFHTVGLGDGRLDNEPPSAKTLFPDMPSSSESHTPELKVLGGGGDFFRNVCHRPMEMGRVSEPTAVPWRKRLGPENGYRSYPAPLFLNEFEPNVPRAPSLRDGGANAEANGTPFSIATSSDNETDGDATTKPRRNATDHEHLTTEKDVPINVAWSEDRNQASYAVSPSHSPSRVPQVEVQVEGLPGMTDMWELSPRPDTPTPYHRRNYYAGLFYMRGMR